MKRILMLAGAWLALIFGAIGVFVPVLPTTPWILLAAFLFSKSSPRLNAWVESTWLYRTYALPFKEQGGIPRRRKMHIISISLLVLGISAFCVQKPLIWGMLGCVAIFLLYLLFVRIPTIPEKRAR